MPTTIDRRTGATLGFAFGAVTVLLVVSQVVAYFQWTDVQVSVDAIEKNALVSVELVGRMGIDIGRERSLIERHIFEHEGAAMTELESEIQQTKRDFAVAANGYSPLATFPGEADAWRGLTVDVALLDKPITAALDASRGNRNTEAAAAMTALEPVFDAIARDVATLVEINHTAADRARERTAHLELSVLGVRSALSAFVLIVTLLAGIWVTRVVVRIQRRLVRNASELEVRNRELDAFAGRVAHDLRGPLNTISLSASMLAERTPDAKTATVMERGIAQMTSLVEDLLALSRVGSMVGSVARTEPIASALETDLGALVKDAGGALRVDLQPAAVSCSEGLLRQLLWNLGENAVKYRRSDVPAAIELIGRRTAERYEIRVIDNGQGMSSEDATHAFEPFYRCAATSSVPGTGLGLAIVRRIAEASGGTVSVDSKPGHGSTFKVVLLLAQVSDPRLALPEQ